MTDDAMMGVKGKRLWPYFLALEKWSHWWQRGLSILLKRWYALA